MTLDEAEKLARDYADACADTGNRGCIGDDLARLLLAVLPVVKAAASLVDSWDGPVAMKAGVSYDDEIARASALIAAIDAIRGGVT